MNNIKKIIVEKIIKPKMKAEKSSMFFLKGGLSDFATINLIIATTTMASIPVLMLFLQIFAGKDANLIIKSMLTLKNISIIIGMTPILASLDYFVKKIKFKKIKNNTEKLISVIEKNNRELMFDEVIFNYPEFFGVQELLNKVLSKKELEMFSNELSKIKTKEQIRSAINSYDVKRSLDGDNFTIKYIWEIIEYLEREDEINENKKLTKKKEKIQDIIFDLNIENKEMKKEKCYVS